MSPRSRPTKRGTDLDCAAVRHALLHKSWAFCPNNLMPRGLTKLMRLCLATLCVRAVRGRAIVARPLSLPMMSAACRPHVSDGGRLVAADDVCAAAAEIDYLAGVPKNEDGVPVDEDGAPLSKNALKKLKKMAETAAKRLQKKAQKAAAAAEGGGGGGGGGGPAADVEEPPATYSFSDPGVLRSSATVEEQQRAYESIKLLGTPSGAQPGQELWVRGRLGKLRAGASNCFIVLRAAGQYTVQACFFKEKSTPKQSKEMLTSLAGLTEESVIDVRGELVEATVTGCSQSNVEVQIKEVVVVSKSLPKLPFEIEEAGRSEAEILASEETERPIARIGQDLRLEMDRPTRPRRTRRSCARSRPSARSSARRFSIAALSRSIHPS